MWDEYRNVYLCECRDVAYYKSAEVANPSVNPRFHPTNVGWNLGLTRKFPTSESAASLWVACWHQRQIYPASVAVILLPTRTHFSHLHHYLVIPVFLINPLNLTYSKNHPGWTPEYFSESTSWTFVIFHSRTNKCHGIVFLTHVRFHSCCYL